VHRYNNKYGYGDILRHYCGVDHTTPIWGEVQHSLFLNTRYFTADGRLGPPREQRQRFPRLLSWQTLLPFPHQIPIGDPLLYESNRLLPDRAALTASGIPAGEYNVFMPKLNNEVPLTHRLDVYVAGVREAIERSGSTPVLVSLHPREMSVKNQVQERLAEIAEVVWAPEENSRAQSAWSQALVAQATTVFSDYLGAHVFRASWFFDRPVTIVGQNPINSATSTEMSEYLVAFVDAQSEIGIQKDVSRELLGVQFVRPPEELADILGFIGWRRVAGRPVRVVYQRVRRLRVAYRRRHTT